MKYVLTLCLIVSLAAGAFAANSVDLTIGGLVGDTLRVDWPTTFDIWMENDQHLLGISLGFTLWSDDGVTWQWDAQLDGWGEGGLGAGLACATVVPGSRLDPVDDVLDMTGLLFTEQDMDGVSPDLMLLGGDAMWNGVPAGGLEPVISLHFTPTGITGDVGTLCIDSVFIPPTGAFVFTDDVGGPVYFTQLWPDGGLCYPVANPACTPGDANDDGHLTVGDAVYILNYALKSGPAPADLHAGDANNDCSIDIGDAIFLINNIFKGGPAPKCSYCVG